MAIVFFYLRIFTGSVGRRLLLVVPEDILYRTSIISSSTVLPLNLFVNLSLTPLSLFLTYGPDLGMWPDFWVSAEFLRAPIPIPHEKHGRGRVIPPPRTIGASYCPFNAERQARKLWKPIFIFVGLTRPGTELELTVSAADALSTWPLRKCFVNCFSWIF